MDSEIRRLVEAGHIEADVILKAKRDELEVLAKALLEFETLSGDEIKNLLMRQTAPIIMAPPTTRKSFK
jgi:cell division protease FtsH